MPLDRNPHPLAQNLKKSVHYYASYNDRSVFKWIVVLPVAVVLGLLSSVEAKSIITNPFPILPLSRVAFKKTVPTLSGTVTEVGKNPKSSSIYGIEECAA